MSKKLTLEEKNEIYESVVPIAMKYRNEFIDINKPIDDSFQLIEQLGFCLLRFPALGNNTDLSGFFIEKSPIKCIYINTRNNLGRQYMSVWHEYFHAVTGEGKGYSYASESQIDKIEYKADCFAGIILMPELLVREYIDSNNINVDYIRHVDIIKMQNYFKVGYSAMLTKIIQLYPEADILNRYAIAKNNEKARLKLMNATSEVKGNLKLIQPTNDVYYPASVLADIEFNFKNERISMEKAYELLNLIDGLGKIVK